MRLILGMLVVLMVVLLVFAVYVMTVPTLGIVAMPLGPWYEKATHSTQLQVAVVVLTTLMAIGMFLMTNRALRSSDYSIYHSVVGRRIRFSLKFPHVSGRLDKSR